MKKRILPALLALAMVLTMLPMASFAAVTPDADGTAEVGTADDLKEALANERATTIKLTTDISVAEALTISRGVTIDLGTHTLTSSVVNGTNGEGQETNTYAVTVSATDKVTIKNGTLSAAGCAGIQSAVDTVTVIELNGLKMTAKKWSVVNRANSTMTVTDCEVTSTNGCAVENNAGSTLNASNSTFSGTNWLMLNRANGTMNFTDCTVTATGNGAVENNGGTMTISGGQYKANGAAVVNHLNGKMDLNTTATSAVNYAVQNDGQMKITGGTYSTTNGAASMSTIMCGTDSAKDQTPAPSLEITNAQVSSTNGNGITPANGASVTIGNGTVVTAKGNAVGGNNTKPTQNTTIQAGAELTSTEGAGIYQPATGQLNIEGGTIKGKVGVVVRAGTVNVTGGTIEATGTGDVNVGDNGQAVPASGIVFDVKSNYSNASTDTTFKVTVGGDATIKAADDQEAVTLVQPDTPVAATSKMEVTGGTFDKPVDPEYLADSLNFEAVDGDGNYSYHATQTEAEDAAGEGGTIGKVVTDADSGDKEVEPIIKIKATGFIWDMDDEAAVQAAIDAGTQDKDTWVDQTIWVAFDQALPAGAHYWFDVEINGETYGIAANGDGTHKVHAFSFLNPGQWEAPPTGLLNEDGTGLKDALTESDMTATITVYKTTTQIQPGGPTDDQKAELVEANQVGETQDVPIPAKPANANPNLKITSAKTDAPLYAKVTVSGMDTSKVYAIRLAKDKLKNNGEMTILIVDNVTTYNIYCKDGQKIWVFEYASKDAIVAGESQHTSLVEGTAQKMA